MTQFLPPNLLALFQARPPIPYLPPPDLKKRKLPAYQGVSSYLSAFEDPADTPPPQPPKPDTKESRKKRKREEKETANQQRITEQLESWDPHENPEATGDAYKTLFVARVAFDTSDRRIKREFEEYGPVKKVTLVKDKEGKSRGYAFIEFEKEKDMRTAYKLADGKKVDGRRVLVDVERGRTVKGWRPRRFGGGLGSSRAPRAPGTKLSEPRHEYGGSSSDYAPSESRRPSDYDRRESYSDRGDRGDRERSERDRYRERSDRERGERDGYSDRGGDRDRDRERSDRYRGSEGDRDRSRDSRRDRDYSDRERYRR